MKHFDNLTDKIMELETSLQYSENPLEKERIAHDLRNCNSRNDICNWIKNEVKPRHQITLTPNINLHEINFEKCVNEIIKMLNHEYFGKRFDQKNKNNENYKKVENNKFFFSGVVIREFQLNGTVHYHILISDHNVFKWKSNRNKYFDTKVIEKCFRIKNNPKYSSVTERNVIDVFNGLKIQEYYNDNLEEYLTKSLEKKPNNTDFVAPIGIDGFVFENKSTLKPEVKRRHDIYYDKICPGAKNVSLKVMKTHLKSVDNMRNFQKNIRRRKENKEKQDLIKLL